MKRVTNDLEENLFKRGISYNELAKAVGVRDVTIQQICTKHYNPSVELSLKISEYLEMDINDLFYLVELC